MQAEGLCCTPKKLFKGERASHFREDKWLLTFREAWRKWMRVPGSITHTDSSKVKEGLSASTFSIGF